MDESAIKIITIVWVGLIPPVIILAIFCFMVLASDRYRLCHYLIASAMVSRLGHCCVVIVILALYALEHWNWPKEICYVTTWLWITFWIGDFLTVFLYSIYYNIFFGHRLVKRKVRGTLLMFLVWVAALLIGGMSVFKEKEFKNYNPADESCVLDLTLSTKSVRIAAVLIHILGPLFCFLLCITINAEFKSLRVKHRLYCKTNSFNVQNGDAVNGHTTENRITSGISNDLNKNTAQINQNSTDSSGNQNNGPKDLVRDKEVSRCGIIDRGNGVKECSYISNTRDTRNVITVLTVFTILLNCLPQLVLYSMEIISEKPSEYTHYILVSFGLVHGLSLPLLLCMSTHRYCYISVQIIKAVCCRQKKTSKKNAGSPQPNNASSVNNATITQSSDTSAENNVIMVPVEEHIVPVDIEKVHSEPPKQSNEAVKALTPPPLPISRHPSFKSSPVLAHRTSVVIINNHSEKTETSERQHTEPNPQDIQDELDNKQPNGYVNNAFTGSAPNILVTQQSENDNSQQTYDDSVKYIDLEAEKEKNKPRNALELSAMNIARSNSAVMPPHTNEKELQAAIKRTSSTSKVEVEKNEGPFVEWNDTFNTGTLLMKRIQSGDQSYLSTDYHHDNINSDIANRLGHDDNLGELNNIDPYEGEDYINSNEESDESSYYDSDSAGWSHMYTTDTDRDNETLERNKDKILAKKMAAKRMPSNISSLGSETLKKKKNGHRRKKKKKKEKPVNKNVEKGLGSALQTMIFMPGAQVSKSKVTHNKELDSQESPLTVNVEKNSNTADFRLGQISPAIGVDGKPIEIPPPPSYPPPPPPIIGGEPSTNMVEEATQTNSSLQRNSGPVFPTKVLPLQSNYRQNNQVHEMQSFSKATSKQLLQQDNLHNSETAKTDIRGSNQAMENDTKDIAAQNQDQENSNYHPSILSIVKQRTKAQVNWQKAITALSVTAFLRKASLGVVDNGHTLEENESEWGESGSLRVSNAGSSRLKRGLDRESAHTYVNTGPAGMYSSYKSNKSYGQEPGSFSVQN